MKNFKKLRNSHQFKIKTRTEITEENRKNQILSKSSKIYSNPHKQYKPHLIKKEMRLLTSNIERNDIRLLTGPEDVRLVRKTLPVSHKLYEPPIQTSFLVNSYQSNSSFMSARKKRTVKSMKRNSNLDNTFHIDWERVSL